MNITQELIIFFNFLISGAVGGMFFDFLRAIRKNTKTNNVIIYIEDFLFWVIIGGITLFTAYLSSEGKIRVYMLIAMLLGAVIYFFSLSKFAYKLFNSICRYLLELIRKIAMVLSKEGKNEKKAQGI